MIKTKIQIKMMPTAQIIKRLGLDATGDVQRYIDRKAGKK